VFTTFIKGSLMPSGLLARDKRSWYACQNLLSKGAVTY
jgi:hypothetical protein